MSNKTNIEEDKKILERIRNIFEHLKYYGWTKDIRREIDPDKAVQAIENTLADRERLLEDIEIQKDNYQILSENVSEIAKELKLQEDATIDEIYTAIKILKIERTKYEVIEEKKELLTEEEKEFLKSYIKIIEKLNNGDILSIRKQSTWIIIKLKTGLEYQAEIGVRFKEIEDCKVYTLKELGL